MTYLQFTHLDVPAAMALCLAIALCFASYLIWSLRSGCIFLKGKYGPVYRAKDPDRYWGLFSLLAWSSLTFLGFAIWAFYSLQP